MTSEQSIERRSNRWHIVTVLIAILSLSVAFTGANYQNIATYFSGILFPKADFTVESWTNPTILPYYEFMPSLSVSTEYLVVTSVNLKSEKPYVGEPVQFTISFENKGKKLVEQPRVIIYFVDYMQRVWQIWNKSDVSNIVAKGCSIDYRFPSLDQKIVGSWIFFVLLYDDANMTLVSYETKEFLVTDNAPQSLWQSIVQVLAFVVIVPLGILGRKVISYFRNRKKGKKSRSSVNIESERQDKKKVKG
jgi:hypothetical protein